LNRSNIILFNLADDNLNENHGNENQSKSNEQNLCQIKDYDIIVFGNENSTIVNGILNSEFRSHAKLFSHIPKLSGAQVNVESEIYQF
jgi:hypothetical protein